MSDAKRDALIRALECSILAAIALAEQAKDEKTLVELLRVQQQLLVRTRELGK